MLKTEINDRLQKIEHPTAFLATLDDTGAPQVRPITLMRDEDHFYLATSAGSRKARHILEDGRVEFVTIFCDGTNNGYLRVMGRAERISDHKLMTDVTEANDYPVTQYWKGIDDPDFFFCRVSPSRVEYMRPGDFAATEVTDEYLD